MPRPSSSWSGFLLTSSSTRKKSFSRNAWTNAWTFGIGTVVLVETWLQRQDSMRQMSSTEPINKLVAVRGDSSHLG